MRGPPTPLPCDSYGKGNLGLPTERLTSKRRIKGRVRRVGVAGVVAAHAQNVGRDNRLKDVEKIVKGRRDTGANIDDGRYGLGAVGREDRLRNVIDVHVVTRGRRIAVDVYFGTIERRLDPMREHALAWRGPLSGAVCICHAQCDRFKP